MSIKSLFKRQGKGRKKYAFDRWFMVFLAMLLWTLGTILTQYAFQIPNFLTSPAFWLRMIAVVIALFGWIWLFRIYARSVRVDSTKGKPDEKESEK